MIGKIIRDKRISLNKGHVSESYISNIELNKQSASKKRLRKLAQHLLIDEDFLLCAAGYITADMTSAVAKDKKLFEAMKALCEYGPKKTVIYKLLEGLPQLNDDFLKTGTDDLL
jgi:transcriptional regulator with XRE-family HTH domain